MDFLDPDKKRKHAVRLVTGYILIGIAIGLASLILLFQSYGYDLDRRTGKVIQNGLIFVSAQPESATIYLNGQQKGKTNTRLTVPAGQYSVELQRTGYRSWKRAFNLDGGSIVSLVYPDLIPTTLKPKVLQDYTTTPSLILQSPDRHWIMVGHPDDLNAFDVFDANDPTKAAVPLTIPSGILTSDPGTQSLTLAEWSTDNRHVLLKHSYAGKEEYIMVDRQTPADSFNVNKQFNVSDVTVSLHDKRYDQLYLYDTKALSLKQVDVKTKQITNVESNISAFKSYGSNMLLYATKDSKDTSEMDVKLDQSNKTYLIGRFKNDSFLLDMAQYNNHWLMAVDPVSSGRVSIYQDPVDQINAAPSSLPIPLTLLKIDQATQISFSANTQFIMAEQGNNFAVYDAESNRRYYYTVPMSVPTGLQATWMDGDRILLNVGGKVTVFDYDGINQQTLVPAVEGTIPFFDQGYLRLYTLAPHNAAVTPQGGLTETNLKLNLKP